MHAESVYLLPVVLTGVVNTVFTFFAPYAQSIGMSILMIGAISFGYGVTRFFVYCLATKRAVRQKILERKNRKRNLLMALGVVSFSSVFLAIPERSGLLYLVAFTVMGFGHSLVISILQVAVEAEAPPERRGAAAGIFNSSMGTGALLGPIIGGLLFTSSAGAPFFLPLAGYLIMLPVLLRIGKNRDERIVTERQEAQADS
jgi:MFS family permease